MFRPGRTAWIVGPAQHGSEPALPSMPTVTGCYLDAGRPLRRFDRLEWSYFLDLFRFGELGAVKVASKL